VWGLAPRLAVGGHCWCVTASARRCAPRKCSRHLQRFARWCTIRSDDLSSAVLLRRRIASMLRVRSASPSYTAASGYTDETDLDDSLATSVPERQPRRQVSHTPRPPVKGSASHACKWRVQDLDSSHQHALCAAHPSPGVEALRCVQDWGAAVQHTRALSQQCRSWLLTRLACARATASQHSRVSRALRMRSNTRA